MRLLSPQLIAFIAVCKYQTVHGAAEKLHITQTAVTQRIKNLEQTLNSTLFIRSRKGMTLTPEGEALLRYCHAAKELEGQTIAQLAGGGEIIERELKISAPSSIMQSRITPACQPILKRYPNLLLHFQVNDVENRQQQLKHGNCDLAIIDSQYLTPEMKYKKLKPEQYILVCPYTWRDRNLMDILRHERIIDFDPSDNITLTYIKHFKLTSEIKTGRLFINDTQQLASLIEQGLGYTTLTQEFAEPLLNKKSLFCLNAHKTLDLTPVLAWFHRSTPPKYFTEIIENIH